MNRINVTFYDETIEKLQDRMKKNGEKSLANCVRELVDLGLKVEAAANKSGDKNGEFDIQKALTDLQEKMRKNLDWVLESRLLTRYMVQYFPGKSEEESMAMLKECKAKAASHVENLGKTPIE